MVYSRTLVFSPVSFASARIESRVTPGSTRPDSNGAVTSSGVPSSPLKTTNRFIAPTSVIESPGPSHRICWYPWDAASTAGWIVGP
eukprot:gene19566-biopygen19849